MGAGHGGFFFGDSSHLAALETQIDRRFATPFSLFGCHDDYWDRNLGGLPGRNYLQKKRPSQVVVDEIVGQLLTFGLIFRNPRFVLLLMGFLFFRLFDIIKPFPIRRLERVPVGFGIVLDDLAAGFYASLIIFAVHLYWPI